MKIIVRLCKKIEEKIDTYSIQKKLILLYVCCVVLPVALTDSVVVGMISVSYTHLTLPTT